MIIKFIFIRLLSCCCCCCCCWVVWIFNLSRISWVGWGWSLGARTDHLRPPQCGFLNFRDSVTLCLWCDGNYFPPPPALTFLTSLALSPPPHLLLAYASAYRCYRPLICYHLRQPVLDRFDSYLKFPDTEHVLRSTSMCTETPPLGTNYLSLRWVTQQSCDSVHVHTTPRGGAPTGHPGASTDPSDCDRI